MQCGDEGSYKVLCFYERVGSRVLSYSGSNKWSDVLGAFTESSIGVDGDRMEGNSLFFDQLRRYVDTKCMLDEISVVQRLVGRARCICTDMRSEIYTYSCVTVSIE